MRRLFVVLAALWLAGCNLVLSEQPWFTARDDAPRLRPGLWAFVKSPTCKFDPASAVTEWPECAGPVLVRGSELVSPQDASKADDPAARKSRLADVKNWQATTPVFAAGDPMIWQLHPEAKAGDGGDASTPLGEVKVPYVYLASRVTMRGPQGQMQTLRLWPVFCGPPPLKRSGKTHSLDALADESFTDRPFPGLKRHDPGCVAASEAALREAAVRSEAVAAANGVPPLEIRWVRETVEP